jgi:hypothetical protein
MAGQMCSVTLQRETPAQTMAGGTALTTGTRKHRNDHGQLRWLSLFVLLFVLTMDSVNPIDDNVNTLLSASPKVWPYVPCTPFAPNSARRPRQQPPAEDMPMQMVDGLPALRANVGDDAVATLGDVFGTRYLRCHHEQVPHQVGVRRVDLGEAGNMRTRDDQHMHGRTRIDVAEGDHALILVHLLRGDVTTHDLAENAVFHLGCPFLAVSSLARQSFSLRFAVKLQFDVAKLDHIAALQDVRQVRR